METKDYIAPAVEKRSMSDAVRIASLLIGDMLVFLLFSAVGRRSHGEAADLDTFLQIVLTATPFVIGWFIVAPFTGAFRRGLETQPTKMAQWTILSWLPAWIMGFTLRGIFVNHAVPPISFGIVSLLSNMLLLLLWRVLFARIVSSRAL
jgi:hypothetical protein